MELFKMRISDTQSTDLRRAARAFSHFSLEGTGS